MLLFFLLKHHASARKAKFNAATGQVLEIHTFIDMHRNTYTHRNKVQEKIVDVHSAQAEEHFVFKISTILLPNPKS